MNYNNMNSQEIGTEFIKLLLEREKLEKQLTELNKKISKVDTILADKMQEEGIDEITINGVKLTTVIDETFSIKGHKWDSELFFNWLKEIGEADLIKTKLTVHPATRNKFLKELREQGISLPDFIEVKLWQHTKYNKSEVKRLASNE